MKYSPSLPKRNDNVSHNHPFSEFVLLCAGLAALFVLTYWILGLFVDLAADSISYETESAIFNSVSNHFEFNFAGESEEQKRAQALIDDLQSCTQLPYEVRVRIVASDEPNAMALPGGNIIVYSGLLEAIDSENGLAFVLAHELGHFKNRDHLRSMGRSLILYMLSSLVTGGDSSISSILLPTSIFSQAQYSQERESLADKTALDTVHCRYGHVNEATAFFTTLLDMKIEPDSKVFHYFSSHPQLQKRIADLKRYGTQQGYAFD